MGLIALREEDALRPLAGRVDSWVRSILEPYLDRLPSNPNRSSKIFQDAVWGAIELRPSELYLLDSPLLQRLRYISQLGVAHFLFPTIGYSRFEHSLGALHQLSRMISAITRSRDPAQDLRKAGYEQCLRYAALLHDVGHCAFSHVSEKFYQFHPDMVAARREIESLYRKRPSASETLSLLIVTSPLVRQFLVVPLEQDGTRELTDEDATELIAAAIAGADSDPWHPYLTNMVNGTVDCDKLDYLARDGAMAGTPVMLDVTRLLSKLRVAQSPKRPDLLALGMDITGTRALEEMLATRVFLYDKIYFHHKILAAEELLRRALAQLEEAHPEIRDPAVLLALSDSDLLRLPNTGTFATDAETQEKVGAARRLFGRVENRALPRRQFALAHRFWLRPPALIGKIASALPVEIVRYDKKVARVVLNRLTIDDERVKLANEIQAYAADLGVDQDVYVSWPDAERVAFGTGSIPAVDADGGVSDLATIFAAELWVEAYGANKQTGYVFADSPRPELFLSVERALGAKGLFLEDQAWKFAKVSRREIKAVRDNFLKTANINWLPHRLPPNYLLSDEAEVEIDAISNKLAQYLAQHNIDTRLWTRAWLWQFPDADLQESAIRVLKQMRIVNRGDRNDAWRWFRETVGTYEYWSELAAKSRKGSSSSARVGYETKDLGDDAPDIRKFWEFSPDEFKEQGAIVFLDDILCSGTQAASLFCSWMGKPELAPSPNDVDEALLPTEYQDLLRSLPVHIVYPIGWNQGRDLLLDYLEKLGITAFVHFHAEGDEAGATLKSVEFASPESAGRLYEFLQGQGESLLQRKNPNWTAEKHRQFALGYGELGALVASDHSIPTATVTALWAHDYRPASMWLPMLPRDINAYHEFWTTVQGVAAENPAAIRGGVQKTS